MRTEADDLEIISGLLGTAEQQLQAIDKAYRRYAEPLASFIRESVAPTLDPQEVATSVNETFLGLARRAAQGKFHANMALATLLFSIARFKAYDQLRQKTAYLRHQVDVSKVGKSNEERDGDMSDEEFTQYVEKALKPVQQISDPWKRADEQGVAKENVRQFRLWIGTQSGLQRKVAEALLATLGDVTNEEICNWIGKTGPRPLLASVKSARREISRKFEQQLKSIERKKTA